MRIVTANANGVRAAARKGLPDLLRDLDADLVCLQETRASAAQARNVGRRLDHQLASASLARRARAYEVRREPVVSDHAPLLVAYDDA